jgi:hypothetical protein
MHTATESQMETASSAIPELHPITAAIDKLMEPAKGSATEWLLSVTPILERQRAEIEAEKSE